MEFFKFVKTEFFKNFFPEEKCIFCGRDLSVDNCRKTCEVCNKAIPYNTPGKHCNQCDDKISDASPEHDVRPMLCYICEKEAPYFFKARSCFEFKDEVCAAIHKFKYSDAKYMAKPFAEYMAYTFTKERFKADVIVPVPLSEKKLKLRGYNQSELLAIELSKILNIPICTNSLIKHKETKSQTTLELKKRKDNVRGSFKIINEDNLKDKVVLLIDDVLTTSATINECSRLLNSSENKIVRNVYVLTIARTVLI